MKLTKTGETSTKIMFTYDKPPGDVDGYLYFVDDRQVSRTLDPNDLTVTFAKGASKYAVEAISFSQVARAEWPEVPVSGDYGSQLWKGFEWAQAESTGPVFDVATTSELLSALSRSGAIVDGGGRSFALNGNLSLPNNGALTTLQNAKLTGGRVDKSNSAKWRLRNLDISLGNPEDNIKGSSGAFLHVDNCRVHNAPKQGVLLYPHSDFVMSNCRLYENGSNTNQDHGIYTGSGSRLLIFNCIFYNNQAYQGQFYPHYHGGLVVCCTFYGGRTRGGIIVGSEGGDPVSDLRFVGIISANNSHGWGYEAYGTLGSGIRLEDCLGWANSAGDFDSGSWTVTRPRHGDPKFADPGAGDFSPLAGSAAKGIIDQSLWPLVPPTDIDGKPRVTADAGALVAV